jgi:hypothetical protein
MAFEQELENLRVQTERNTNAANSAAALIGTLAQMVRDAADDPEQVRALADQIGATADSLGAAVTENTPTT